MSSYLDGKILQANSNLMLTACEVDGKVYSSSDMFIPTIFKNHYVKVISCEDDVVVLENISNDDWHRCTVYVQDIENFKVKSNIEI